MKLFRKKTVRVPEEIVNQTVDALLCLENIVELNGGTPAAVKAAASVSELLEFYLRWAK